MARKFRDARQMNKLTVVEAAEKLGVKQPSLSAWENGSRTPTVENLIAMAELYSVTTDYLLGRASEPQSNPGSRALTAEELRVRNGQPVWSERHGWLLVDAGAGFLLRSDGAKLPLLDAGELYQMPPAFAVELTPERKPLRREDLTPGISVWVEPISPDPALRADLRGRYRIGETFAENDVGNRFPLSSYTARWLAFQE
jgi:transcriptional regulator with XRE-family HTH domain